MSLGSRGRVLCRDSSYEGVISDRAGERDEGHRPFCSGPGDQGRLAAYGFQNVMMSPPLTTNEPPAKIGRVGSVRKNRKLMICQTTNSVAI